MQFFAAVGGSSITIAIFCLLEYLESRANDHPEYSDSLAFVALVASGAITLHAGYFLAVLGLGVALSGAGLAPRGNLAFLLFGVIGPGLAIMLSASGYAWAVYVVLPTLALRRSGDTGNAKTASEIHV